MKREWEGMMTKILVAALTAAIGASVLTLTVLLAASRFLRSGERSSHEEISGLERQVLSIMLESEGHWFYERIKGALPSSVDDAELHHALKRLEKRKCVRILRLSGTESVSSNKWRDVYCLTKRGVAELRRVTKEESGVA